MNIRQSEDFTVFDVTQDNEGVLSRLLSAGLKITPRTVDFSMAGHFFSLMSLMVDRPGLFPWNLLIFDIFQKRVLKKHGG